MASVTRSAAYTRLPFARTIVVKVLSLVWFLTLALQAQPQQPARVCPDSTIFFEFQVGSADGQPARWISDSSLAVHPMPKIQSPPNLVQFVVDTAGVPVARSFHVLKVTDSAIVAEARASITRWRFTPAIRDGCHVRQLVQTPIGR